MEKEIASSVNLSITLIAISIVITIVVFTVKIGSTYRDSVFEQVGQTQVELESGQLASLSMQPETVMVKAAAYAILVQEHAVINSLKCYIKTGTGVIDSYRLADMKIAPNGKWYDANNEDPDDAKYLFPEDIMSTDLAGKVVASVTRNSYGTYDIILNMLEE